MSEVLPLSVGTRRLSRTRRIGGGQLPIREASFTGHESFPLRYAWLKKGFDGLMDDEGFFARDDAMVIMGTGKNMVRSIRHWGISCQMWSEQPGSRGRELAAGVLGRFLLRDGGWDPYLEDVGTSWLLHWLMVTNGDRATTWAWVFSRPKGGAFSKQELLAELEQLTEEFGKKKSTRASLKRDLDVFLRSYLRGETTARATLEDALDCPTRQLGLIRPGVERGTYELVSGTQPLLPAGIFNAAVADYLRNIRGGDTATVPLDELMYASFSPGRVFRLTEEGLVARLSRMVETLPSHFDFDETAGLRQLIVKGEVPDHLEVIEDYYGGGAS